MSEETEPKKEKKPPRKEIPVPFYFDKYIECEFRALRQLIDFLREDIDRKFADLRRSIDERFARVDRRIDELEKRIASFK